MPLRDSSENAIPVLAFERERPDHAGILRGLPPECAEAVIVLHTANEVLAMEVLRKM